MIAERLMEEGRSPLIVERHRGDDTLARHAHNHAAELCGKLLHHGALLFRGFEVRDVAAFDAFIDALGLERSDYLYRSTPRQAVGKRIFTASEFPPSQEIPLHNENAYQRAWPLKIAFCCLRPASRGGETPLADMRSVREAVGREWVDMFEARGVRYVRHYRPSVDIPWQEVFGTNDRAALASFLDEEGIAHEWLDAETLRTTQVCQGTAVHPVTHERVFFNQAHLFHASSLGPELMSSMCQLFGRDRLPRDASFGDGAEIPGACLERIRAAFREASFTFTWQMGDVLLLDNMQFAHGRRPYEGTRTQIAALMDPHRPGNS